MQVFSKTLSKFSLAFLVCFTTPPCAIADGRIEINQASVEAAGGFPFTITEPGSYVLTGNLSVPADTNGIVIDTDEITLDLNGFSISGPATCTPSSCDSGSTLGIAPQNFLTDATGTTVRNGVVRGFSAYCVWLTRMARVENLFVTQCGWSGIIANSGVITGNRILNTGQAGLAMGAETAFAHNKIGSTGLGGGGQRAVEGGRASAGNSCDDYSCSPRGERRYYVTPDSFHGDEALTACAPGFHMASLWELFEPSTLYYDVDLGDSSDDSGSGPPNQAYGWIRTGIFAFSQDDAGRANCNAWTSDDAGDNGTLVSLDFNWQDAPGTSSPWDSITLTCSNTGRVWCMED